MLCQAADWVHLKMLLYAIGSGNIGSDNVKNLHSQWRAHLRSFGAPLGALLTCPACRGGRCLSDTLPAAVAAAVAVPCDHCALSDPTSAGNTWASSSYFCTPGAFPHQCHAAVIAGGFGITW